jgi:16S rRNA (guanine527-N7)-methyltransferase
MADILRPEMRGSFPAFLDLGSGAGVPGLVLADAWPESTGVLLDSNRRRCALLDEAVVALGLDGRLSVRCGRAEVLAHDEGLRATFGLVVARSFGSPAVTAECAVGFLRVGGCLAVTEPPPDRADPEDATRWPTAELATLGLGPARVLRSGSTGVAAMSLKAPPRDDIPRSDGRPGKSPLW